ncbi:MAG: hypothetical protein V4858_05930 [Pseudomonadota bacterium]
MPCMSFCRFFPLALCAILLCSPVGARTFSVCIPSNPFPPLTFPDHEGQGQWLLRTALERQGHTVQFEAVPWPRCTRGVLQGSYDAAIPVASTRVGSMAFPLDGHDVDANKALGNTVMVVVRRVDSRAGWDGKNFTNLSTPVMFNRGIVTVRDKLTKLGVPGDEGAQANKALLKKLLQKRNELLIMNAQAVAAELESEEYAGKLEILKQPFLTMSLHVAFNLDYYENNRALVDAIWTRIAELRTTPEWAKLAPILGK